VVVRQAHIHRPGYRVQIYVSIITYASKFDNAVLTSKVNSSSRFIVQCLYHELSHFLASRRGVMPAGSERTALRRPEVSSGLSGKSMPKRLLEVKSAVRGNQP
jgi:hypothetical protein